MGNYLGSQFCYASARCLSDRVIVSRRLRDVEINLRCEKAYVNSRPDIRFQKNQQ